jgi:hypothetical protein
MAQAGVVNPGQYSPAEISAFWSGVAALTAVVTGIVAIVTLLALRRDSRDRARPVISADLLPVVLSDGTSELVIQNVGAGVAKNVAVQFEPVITEGIGPLAGFLSRRYQGVIPTMGPGRRLTNVYGVLLGDGSQELLEQVPSEVTVTIRYEDSHGRTYADAYCLSIETLRHETVSVPGNSDEAGMRRRLVEALEAIARGVAS